MKPQTEAILGLLRQRGAAGVTSLEAFTATGCFRLAGRVHELRAVGFDVETTYVTTPSRKVIARYVLHEEPVQMAAGF